MTQMIPCLQLIQVSPDSLRSNLWTAIKTTILKITKAVQITYVTYVVIGQPANIMELHLVMAVKDSFDAASAKTIHILADFPEPVSLTKTSVISVDIVGLGNASKLV